MTDIHSCSYYCDRPECIKAQRDELRERLAQPEQEPVGDEWTPCMKLPVVVHVRKQRLGETHVSTREGITPVKRDDLIMRGVSGEEYPIGRAIFEQTYSLNTTPPQRKPEQEPAAWECKAGGLKRLSQRLYEKQPDNIKRHYTRIEPPQRKPLTDEEIDALVVQELGLDADADAMNEFARAIEAAHGIGENPDAA